MCIRIYFLLKKTTKKTEEKRKGKETKEEKEKENVVAVNSICGKSNGIQCYQMQICCVLLTEVIES